MVWCGNKRSWGDAEMSGPRNRQSWLHVVGPHARLPSATVVAHTHVIISHFITQRTIVLRWLRRVIQFLFCQNKVSKEKERKYGGGAAVWVTPSCSERLGAQRRTLHACCSPSTSGAHRRHPGLRIFGLLLSGLMKKKDPAYFPFNINERGSKPHLSRRTSTQEQKKVCSEAKQKAWFQRGGRCQTFPKHTSHSIELGGAVNTKLIENYHSGKRVLAKGSRVYIDFTLLNNFVHFSQKKAQKLFKRLLLPIPRWMWTAMAYSSWHKQKYLLQFLVCCTCLFTFIWARQTQSALTCVRLPG